MSACAGNHIGAIMLNCAKAYDIRGKVGTDLTDEIAHRLGQAFAIVMGPGPVVVGRDCRLSSPALQSAVIAGLRAQGVDVIDIGLSGTEEVYFAVDHLSAAGGIEVTASHNPIDYNGLKFVGPGSRPLEDVSEFQRVLQMAEADAFTPCEHVGTYGVDHLRGPYADKLAAMVDTTALKPLKLLVNAGNGVAGAAFDAIMDRLLQAGAPLEVIRINHEPDGRFPHGIPNPLLPENRTQTADAVRAHQCDLGIAWDGDFDRCFFFDETGGFIDGEYIVGLLAQSFLASTPGEVIVHDPRVIWNTQDAVRSAGGRSVLARTGHVFIKAAMRSENAIYGGEISAHHYFRDFMYCDSGMIPWLKLIEVMSRHTLPLSCLIADRKTQFASSGELNFTVTDAADIIHKIEAHFTGFAMHIDHLDGLSMHFEDWRFNLRRSSTEPLLRLNVETRNAAADVAARVAALKQLIFG